ncbi:MAG: hypothetical protein ACF8XB_00595 [Planctomycetota bacterium JB042]
MTVTEGACPALPAEEPGDGIGPEKTPPFPRGLCCPKCGGHVFRVLETRPAPGRRIRRRRRCQSCLRYITTYEQIA